MTPTRARTLRHLAAVVLPAALWLGAGCETGGLTHVWMLAADVAGTGSLSVEPARGIWGRDPLVEPAAYVTGTDAVITATPASTSSAGPATRRIRSPTPST
jgi:hypothetical protein